MTENRNGTVVIGLGNPIMGDDGFGLAVLARLRDGWLIPDDVELVDGGTWGLTLLPIIEAAERVLLLDAIETGAHSNAIVTIQRDELPGVFALRTSPHQVDLCDVLALARLRGTLPTSIVAIGVQPDMVDMIASLSPRVEAAVDGAAAAAVRQLAAWGCVCARRQAVHA